MHIETERKFLIKLPDAAVLAARADRTLEITQTYLKIDKKTGEEQRVRRIVEGGETTYIFTEKKKISDFSRYENEFEITKERYDTLIKEAPDPRALTKTRYVIGYMEHNIEIDVYPHEIGGDALDGFAVLEVELGNIEEDFAMPDFISVERELTGKSEFSNKSLAKPIK